MNLEIGKYYQDNDDTVYICRAIKHKGTYSEAVMEVVGENLAAYFQYAIFYRNNWAWSDRENPDFRLTHEVEYLPCLV